jgi:hypothetical protein
MNLSLIIYLIGVIDGIKLGVAFLCILLGLGIFIGIIYLINEYPMEKEQENKIKNKIKNSIIYFIIILIFVPFIPNSKTIAAMYLVPKLSKNEQIKQLPDKTLILLNGKLDEWINKLTDKKG